VKNGEVREKGAGARPHKTKKKKKKAARLKTRRLEIEHVCKTRRKVATEKGVTALREEKTQLEEKRERKESPVRSKRRKGREL